MATLATAASNSTVSALQMVNDAALVYHIDLLLVAFMAVFVLVRLPRAFALLGSSSDWLNGHFLRHAPYRPSRRLVQAVQNAYPPPLSKEDSSQGTDDTHILYPHNRQIQRLTEKGAPAVMNFPPHITSCVKPLRPLLKPLRARISPGFSVAQGFVLGIYFYTLFYAGLYRSNLFTDLTRTGWIALAQLPFAFAFAQKNNVLGSFLGYGYEKLNFLHRFIGRIIVLASNIHSLHFFYKWTLEGSFQQNIKTNSAIMGMIALVCIDMIFLFSVQYVRNKAYNLFLTTHIIGFIAVLPAVYQHKPNLLPYPLACLCFYLFDHVARLIKSRFTKAYIRPLPELDLTRVEIPSLNAGWRAGQHIRLRVCSFGMGWGGWAEVHPFTIASVSRGPEGMVLMCKRAGGWTRKLYEMAKMGGYTEGGVGREVRVVVEGPYGGPGHTIYASFSAAVFVAGGSGITYALSVIQDLVQKDLRGESRVKVIELVWSVTDPACLAPLLPTFTALIQQSVFTPVRISVFYTRAPTGKQPAFFAATDASPFAASPPAPPSPTADDGHENGNGGFVRPRPPPSKRPSSPYQSPRAAPQPPSANPRTSVALALQQQPKAPVSHFPPGLTLAPGRPRLAKFLESALQRAVTLSHSPPHMYSSDYLANPKDDGRLSGMVVGVCGPVALSDDVVAAVGGLDPVRRDQVGGVEVCEEVFGW
ncbi:hypothetical protein GALMADRAFT_214680 [Galerina marginata CBS 339.88]|uniref:ferric-chelate reductase (NADPH) n=1 Tax=Galerina marginata (strain CBS 339.88) TaxID=685588 RepID=A0A067SRB2_GALM3|nr:hypothetical protein GALMADRAFT_214680 [Galerina marginata CBS 339.88]